MSNYTESDVIQAAEAVRSALERTTVYDLSREELSFLKSAALEGAKVPGLVQKLKEALGVIESGRLPRRLPDAALAPPLHEDLQREVSALQARLSEAEGRVAELAASEQAQRERAEHWNGQADALQARVAELTKERDEALAKAAIAPDYEVLEAQWRKAEAQVAELTRELETQRTEREAAEKAEDEARALAAEREQEATVECEARAVIESERDALRAQMHGARMRVLHAPAYSIESDFRTEMDIALTDSDVSRAALSATPAETKEDES